jgi:hypothetical protein
MASLVLPKEYAAVLGVFALTPGLLLWQGSVLPCLALSRPR